MEIANYDQKMSFNSSRDFRKQWSRRKQHEVVVMSAESKLCWKTLKTPFFFLRLDLPSTLIRTKNKAFRKCSSNRRNLKSPAFQFRVDGKTLKSMLFENDETKISPALCRRCPKLFLHFVLQMQIATRIRKNSRTTFPVVNESDVQRNVLTSSAFFF